MIKNFPKCICGGDEYEVVHKGEWVDKVGGLSFSILRCLNCDLLRTFPVPKETIATEEETKHRLKNLELWKSFGKELVELTKRYQENKKLKVLDIGCNLGIFVKLAEENGWEAVGIDTDEKVIKLGREKFRVNLRNTKLEEAGFKSGEFDVVVLEHTLEHIFEPLKLIRIIRKIPRRGGIIIVRVPNVEGLPIKIQNLRGEIWYGYNPRQHVWHFTQKTLRQLLESEGFEILELQANNPMHYEKTGSFWDIPRDLILKFSGLLGLADQITLVATPQK